MFDSLKISEGTVFLPDGLSYEIKGSRTISMKLHDRIVKKLGEVRYIPNFKKNLISLSKLNSTSFK